MTAEENEQKHTTNESPPWTSAIALSQTPYINS